MAYSNIKFKDYKPSAKEQELVANIESLRAQMDTPYRLRWKYLTKWSRDEYEAMSDEQINNMDLLKIQFCYPIVNQRMATLQTNQSKAVYKTVDPDKEDELKVLEKVEEYDRDISSYNSEYFDIEQTAQIEGTCFYSTYWHEEVDDNGNTIGVPHTRIKRVRLNDFWWDSSARRVRDMNHGLEREVISYEEFRRRYWSKQGMDNYKNIDCVRPMKSEECSDQVTNEDWAEEGRDVYGGNLVTLWHFESLRYECDGEFKPKCVTIANGVLIYEHDELSIPRLSYNDPWILRWSKIDGLPTGQMIGFGIPIVIRHLQSSYNRLITLSVAQAELAVIPPLFVRAGADEDFDDYPGEAGTVIPIRGTGKSIGEDYQFLQVPDITNGAQKLMQDMIDSMIMITGIDVKALFVPASEKAITTQNKKDIQEKMLKFSVVWNEENGFRDLCLMRTRLIQHYYPEKRSFLDEEGMVVERHIEVPMNDTQTENLPGGKVKLNFKEGAYTSLEITPENLKFNVDFTIVGAYTKQEQDIIKKRAFIEDLQLIMSIPAFQEIIMKNSDKVFMTLLDKAGIDKNEFMESVETDSSKLHGALKEIRAIRLHKIINQTGSMKIPEDLDKYQSKNYNPTEYVEIFEEYQQSEGYKQFTKESKRIFEQRMEQHKNNEINPYYKEIKEKAEEKAEPTQGALPAPAAADLAPKPNPGSPGEQLMDKTRSEAAEIAAASR